MIDAATIRSSLGKWIDNNPPASDEAIAELTAFSPAPLPEGYIRLLLCVNGGEVDIGDPDSDDGFYFVLWACSDVRHFNSEYEIPTYAPHHFAFGSNGGGELFALDQRRNDDAVVMLPAIGMDDDAAILVAPSFDDFLSMLV